MWHVVALADQLAAARPDRLRMLIVGAGVAGLSLTGLLRRQGLHPVLVEKAAHPAVTGYMLGMLPLADPVIAQLGADADYRARSQPMTRYRLRGRSGQLIRDYPLDSVTAGFGDWRGIERAELLKVLCDDGAPLSVGTTVMALDQSRDCVHVRLETGTGTIDADVDVVVAADGQHSSVRGLVLSSDRIETLDTGWGGWVAWTEPDAEPDTYEETWGAGYFLGSYPVPGRVGVFLGAARPDTARGPAHVAAMAREGLAAVDERSARALAAVGAEPSPYHWSFTDVRCATWTAGRVFLLGDAGTAFLPTAGVGAAMAVVAAGALARALLDVDAAKVPAALRAAEERQRPRAEAAQRNSRQLARWMFRPGGLLTAARDAGARLMSARSALGSIRRLLEQAPAEPGDPAAPR